MFKLLDGIIDRILVVAGAIVLAQAPHFYQAYTQRLGGHLGEVHNQVVKIRSAAEHSGKTLEEYIAKFTHHFDKDIVQQGEFMEGLTSRLSDLTSAYSALIHSTPWTRPLAFLKHIQTDIASKTFQDFQFGFEFTLETAAYALFGMGLGYLLYSLLLSMRTIFYALYPSRFFRQAK